MADAFSTSLRLQLQATGNNNETWGAIADTQYNLLEAAITGDNGYQGGGGGGGINIAGLTTYTLTVNQGTADQARHLLYPFVGALTADCTVTIPGVVKVGWVANFTTGGHNVILKVGIGGTATIPPGGWFYFYCDGTNVTLPTVAFGALSYATINGNATVGGTLAVSGNTSISGTATAANGTTGSQLVNYSQFPAVLGNPGSVKVPSGMFIKMGNSVVTLSAGLASVSFDAAFPNACITVVGTNGDLNAFSGYLSAVAPTASGFTVQAPAGGNSMVRCDWIAVGW